MNAKALIALPRHVLVPGDACLIGRFEAMACACEILFDTDDRELASELLELALQEVQRIENTYSRYLPGNRMHQLNAHGGRSVDVDDETAALLDYAAQCYDMSDGLFDITTGILRKVWRFDGREAHVDESMLKRVCARIGWDKVIWNKPSLRLPADFEIDFGGICKEYAADRVAGLLAQRQEMSTLVNLGGDIAASGDRLWSIGIEDVLHPGHIRHTVNLRRGAIATSGSTKRYTTLKGKALSHILNPKTGWPVPDVPLSVTVAAKTCTEAGFWSILGMLQGSQAENFLNQQALEFWCYRPS